MNEPAIVTGRSYAFREKRLAGTPLFRVRVLAKLGRRGKLQIRFEDGPYPGLEDYAATRQIICPWNERHAVLRDEQHETQLRAHMREVQDHTLGAAVDAVMQATGESGGGCDAGGTVMGADELQRIALRAGVDRQPTELHYLAYQDRAGNVHVPLDGIVELARAFAKAEPQTVTEYLDDEETELRLRGSVPGDHWYREYLRHKAPAFALVRRWAGLEQDAELLRAEITRLRGLVRSAADELKTGGNETAALRLERALGGR